MRRGCQGRLRSALALAASLNGGVAALHAATPPEPQPVTGTGVTGTVLRYAAFPSRQVAARNVDLWLPPGYAETGATRHPVLYLQDGQNVFDPATAYGGLDWGVDEALTRLVETGAVRPAIVVAVWNTPQRLPEYLPQRIAERVSPAERARLEAQPGGSAVSDAYLRFLVEELKPFVDARYRTLGGAQDTFVMGSSMGALISLYALTEHPLVFGGAACVSTHWPIAIEAMLEYLRERLPEPGRHRLYFDHGTETLDAGYEPHQRRVDALLGARGFVHGRDRVSYRFPGAEHSERSWRERVEVPLHFLLGEGAR